MKKSNNGRMILYFSAVFVAAGMVINADFAYHKAMLFASPGDMFQEYVLYWLGTWFNGFIGIHPAYVLVTLSLFYQIFYLIRWIVGRIVKRVHPDYEESQATDRVSTVMFRLSFLPAVFLLGASIYSGINGTGGGFITPRLEGADAFFDTMIWLGLLMCIIPILPAALGIQIVYIVRRVRRKKKAGSGAE